MALILALNPGNAHSPTLARLARELRGCELIGAESCVAAMTAIKERVPDVVLLPARSARGEADLVSHLKTIPGGVLTLKLPPVESADPTDLARQIREMLTGTPAAVAAAVHSHQPRVGPVAVIQPPAPPATSPHLLAAATAAIAWIHTRQAEWASERANEAPPKLVPQWTGVSPTPREPLESDDGEEIYQPYEPIELADAENPYAADDSASTHDSEPSFATKIKPWLPRAAAVAAGIAAVAALILYWPKARESSGSTEQPAGPTAQVSQPSRADVTPAVPDTPGQKPQPDSVANVSGWVAVFAPFDIQIAEAGQGLAVDERGRAMLAPGRHRLRFQNREFGYDETRTVVVKPTETTTINLTPQTTIAVTASEAADVSIDGTRVGETPYTGTVNLGTRSVTVRTAGAERQLTVEATSKPIALEVDFSKP